ncbi:hypothetical protein GGR52DRAFT_539423 [Hypoxylon sp. FL1284]|nr:hypothetical protein GGR52DRAFT_539423 [Hypoxylon sp. FL1284]
MVIVITSSSLLLSSFSSFSLTISQVFLSTQDSLSMLDSVLRICTLLAGTSAYYKPPLPPVLKNPSTQLTDTHLLVVYQAMCNVALDLTGRRHRSNGLAHRS